MEELQRDPSTGDSAARPSLLTVTLKIGLIAIPTFICQTLVPAHPKSMFCLGMLIGTFLQELVPPRRKLLLPLLLLTGIIATVLKLTS